MMQNVCLTSRKQNFNENSIINKIMPMVSSWLFFRTGPVGKAWEAAIAWFYAILSKIASPLFTPTRTLTPIMKEYKSQSATWMANMGCYLFKIST